MIDSMLNAVLAPFASQVGMQGVAYGLLGLRTINKIYELVLAWAKGDEASAKQAAADVDEQNDKNE